MKNSEPLRIAIAETSVIIRSGLATVLKRVPELNIQPIEIPSPESLQNYIKLHMPGILIVNPTFGGWFDISSFKAAVGKNEVKCISLVCSMINTNLLKDYDETLSIYDDMNTLTTKINQLLFTPTKEKDDGQEALSQREKEIIVCVVKGMTNKTIADQLFLSIHTVITHRRNIARKLQIHSPAGLTIYAIINKLIEIQDVKTIL